LNRRGNLVALPGYADRPAPQVLFCGHCGHVEDRDITPATRVCDRCELGLLVSAATTAAPTEHDPFLLVDSTLSICGVSRRAEELLLASEADTVNTHITDLLVPADIEVSGPEGLVNVIIHAARGEGEMHHVVLRPAREFGIRFWARIAPCGPPKAALVVLADGRS
jgi:hypothetical protein